MAETYAQQLDRVQTAIAKIESGNQEVRFNGRSVRRGDLETLYSREKWLRKMAAREAGSGIRVTQGVPLG